MSRMPPVLADFARQVETLRAVVMVLGEDACTADEFAVARDLAALLETCERIEAGLHLMHMRGARPVDIAGHLGSVNVGDVLWSDR